MRSTKVSTLDGRLKHTFDFLISAPPTMCQKERALALGWDNKPKDGVFVPDCDSEGSYNPIQCLKSEGPCWCVDENGKEVSATRNENGKPDDCPGKEKVFIRVLVGSNYCTVQYTI